MGTGLGLRARPRVRAWDGHLLPRWAQACLGGWLAALVGLGSGRSFHLGRGVKEGPGSGSYAHTGWAHLVAGLAALVAGRVALGLGAVGAQVARLAAVEALAVQRPLFGASGSGGAKAPQWSWDGGTGCPGQGGPILHGKLEPLKASLIGEMILSEIHIPIYLYIIYIYIYTRMRGRH